MDSSAMDSTCFGNAFPARRPLLLITGPRPRGVFVALGEPIPLIWRLIHPLPRALWQCSTFAYFDEK
eukprot:11225695-Lingulodinium_polyedra.AAC.1